MNRNLNIEALRVIAMLSILLLHISGRLFVSEDNVVHAAELAVRSYFFIGVSTFAFISGYYGVKWNIGKFLKYESMAVMWGVIIFMSNILLLGGGELKSILLFIPILSEVCWYYSAYVLLMLVSPFLNDKIKSMDLRQYSLILILMMIICYGGNFVFHRNGTTFNLLFFIYFLGQYIRRRNFELSTGKALLIFFMSTTLTAVAVCASSNIMEGKLIRFICNNHNPLIIISAISLFFAFKNMKSEYAVFQILAKAAPYTFAVYIIHAELLYLNLIPFHSLMFSNQFLCTLVVSIAIFIVCASAEYIRLRIFSNIENNIIQKFINRYKL